MWGKLRFIYFIILPILLIGCANSPGTSGESGRNYESDPAYQKELALEYEPVLKNRPGVSHDTVEENSIPSNEELYKSYTVPISLSQNNALFDRLLNDEIIFAEYDSLLKDLGREGTIYQRLDQLICLTENDSIFREILRADYFIWQDSLLEIADEHLIDLLRKDSTNAAIFLYLGISKTKQIENNSGIEYLQRAKFYSASLENEWINTAIANIYLKEGLLQNAINEYKEGFQRSPKYSIESWSSLFDIYVELGQYTQALNLLNDIETMSIDSDFKANNWRLYNNLFWLMEDYSAAEVFCLKQKNQTDISDISEELFFLAIMNDEYEKAFDIIQKLTPVYLGNIFFNTKIDFLTFDKNDVHFDLSMQHLSHETSKVSHNKSADACFGLMTIGANLFENDDNDKSPSETRKGLAYIKKAQLNSMFADYVIGYLLQENKDPEAAVEYFEKIKSGNEYFPYSQISLSEIFKKEDPPKSLQYLLKAHSALPDNINIITEIGDFYYNQMEDYGNAIKWYQIVLKNDPKEMLRPIWMANAYLQLGDLKNAQKTISNSIDQILTSNSDWFQDWYLGMAYKIKGDIYFKLEKWDLSKREYDNSIRHGPSQMDPRLALGKLYTKVENYNAAEQVLLTVIDSSLSGENVDYDAYGDALAILNMQYSLYQKDPIKHATLFETATKYYPKSGWCYRMLGMAYQNQEAYFRSKNAIFTAIELQPNNRYSYEVLAEVYEAEGAFESSISSYRDAIRVVALDNEENYSIDDEEYAKNLTALSKYHSNIAEIFLEMEDLSSAIAEYHKAISFNPDKSGGMYMFDLASAYFDKGDYELAIEIWKEDYEKGNGVNALFNIALSYINLDGSDNLEQGQSHFLRVIEQIGDNSEHVELKQRAEGFLVTIEKELSRTEWPRIIEKLSSSDSGIESEVAILYSLTDQYREINNLWIQGVEETSPEKEYLEYSKKWIITSYAVSPKIYQSQALCDRFIAKLSNSNFKDNRINEVRELWITAAQTRKSGEDEYAEGFFVKSKEYSGQYEQGSAKITVGNKYYYDGLVILEILMEENIQSFSPYGISLVQDLIDYYSGVKK